MAVRLVSLSDVFPNVHRSTIWRWKREGKLPPPDRIINNRAYYLESRFAAADDTAPEQGSEASQ